MASIELEAHLVSNATSDGSAGIRFAVSVNIEAESGGFGVGKPPAAPPVETSSGTVDLGSVVLYPVQEAR